MRHKRQRGKLNRTTSHRQSLLRNLAKSFIEYGKIKTTLAKAKYFSSFVEKLITLSKKDDVSHRRLLFAEINNRTLVKKMFSEIAPLYKEKNGGYTRIIPLGFRAGDYASMVLIELVKEEILLPKKEQEISK